jgi:ketosteroid isomerase-like protein
MFPDMERCYIHSNMELISADKVRAEIDRFWLILSGKSHDKLEDLYAVDGIVFTGKSKRPEPAILAIARRARRAPASASTMAEVGTLELQIAGDVAVASYTYKYQEERMSSGGRSQRNTLYGRATQVFQTDRKGAVKIVHEHLSAAAAPDERGAKPK